jgi:hypothetical protein
MLATDGFAKYQHRHQTDRDVSLYPQEYGHGVVPSSGFVPAAIAEAVYAVRAEIRAFSLNLCIWGAPNCDTLPGFEWRIGFLPAMISPSSTLIDTSPVSACLFLLRTNLEC